MGVLSHHILHSYKCQTFFVSLPACLSGSQTVCRVRVARAQATLALLQMSTHFRVPACLYGSQTVCPTPVVRASHVRTLINVNPFSCLCVRACLRNISGVATQAKLSGKLRNSTHTGKSSPFIYILYYDIQAYHQHHRLQSSVWTAHQRVTGYISTGYEPKSSWSGGGVLESSVIQGAVQFKADYFLTSKVSK